MLSLERGGRNSVGWTSSAYTLGAHHSDIVFTVERLTPICIEIGSEITVRFVWPCTGTIFY